MADDVVEELRNASLFSGCVCDRATTEIATLRADLAKAVEDAEIGRLVMQLYQKDDLQIGYVSHSKAVIFHGDDATTAPMFEGSTLLEALQNAAKSILKELRP